jgi:Armadillo/beta-catenin-like repeat
MSRELEVFLTTEDLDDLLRARQRLGRVSKRDSHAAVSMLEQWADRQAVANVLFYPDLLPHTVRMPFIMKALEETEFPYYTLAAVVGLQDLTDELETKLEKEFKQESGAAAAMKEDDWKGIGERLAALRERALGPEEWEECKAVRERLLALIEHADEVMRAWDSAATGHTTLDEVIAERATVHLPDIVEPGDARRLVRFLDHPSEGVQNNALWTLIYLLGTEGVERLVVEATEAGEVSPAAVEYISQNDEPMMLFAYIPNLVQTFPAEDTEGDVGD